MKREKNQLHGEYVAARRRRGIGIHGQIFTFLAVFVLAVLFFIWLFQICLLGVFYEKTKYEELKRTAEGLSYYVENEESLRTAVFDYASRYNACISVYQLDGSHADEVIKSHVAGVCAVHRLSDGDLTDLYDLAVANGGAYSATFPVVIEFFEHDPIPPSEEGGAESSEAEAESGGSYIIEESVNAVLTHIVVNSDGTTYILLLDARLTPVSSVVSTLVLQFLWLGAILLVIAGILAFLISRGISRPIVSMNESAKRLAAGEYSVSFSGVGFRESRELAETLNYAAIELSKTDMLRKELIANISHDLRTPLTMIKGYSEVMRDLPGENTPENVQVVIDETERLSELVSDLLDLSKIESGSRVAAPEVFDLTETVRETLLRYEKLISHEGYRISFEADSDAPVYADRTMILQVLYNLINNAVNYTGEDKLVTVTETVTDGVVRISITDTGEGISKDQLPLIWDRYYKVDKVHRRATVGTGLGLSIVKRILELHGAVYGVSSTMGKGSTFWFSLPTLPPDADGIEGDTEKGADV